MNPQQFTAELANAARKTIKATVQAVNPILGAIMAVLNADPDTYHRHADLCPCNSTDEHSQDCPIAILEILSEQQKQRLYRFFVSRCGPSLPALRA